MSVRPLTPATVAKQKVESFPDAVIEAFNEAIAASYVNGRSSFTVGEVVKLMISKGLKRAKIFDNNWLDIEEIYRKAGWTVEYDQPGYNETYEPNFTFTAKRKRP
ncbi:hypothetical protein HYU91_02465 [Candidatus Collierbacteria bacterium]|nr:hypothetical protein [Candidatus Collierbacteria bacterium]